MVTVTPPAELELALELPVVLTPEALLFVPDTLPLVLTPEALVFVADALPVLAEALLLVELVLLPLPGLLSNVSVSPIDPSFPRTYDHVRAVALTTVSLLNP